MDPCFDPEDYNDISDEPVSPVRLEAKVPLARGGERLDSTLALLFPDYSRRRLQDWVKAGHVSVDGQSATLKTKLLGGETLSVCVQMAPEAHAFRAEPVPLTIVYEDDALLVLNKPAGLVVHPAAGHWSGTVLNGLLYHCPALSQLPRAGIVHRLDKDTSGLMVVAKTLTAQTELVRQLQLRQVTRIYRAVADGLVACDGTIDAPIGRDPHQRLRMAVVRFGGKNATTHLRVLQRFTHHTYIECQLDTGRTHQIRVHLRQAGHPLTGDPVYGNPRRTLPPTLSQAARALQRQALHAYRLGLIHPVTQQALSWQTPLPADLRALLQALNAHTASTLTEATDMRSDSEYDDMLG